MTTTEQLVHMLKTCKENGVYGYESWDQVLVDQYNADQTSREGVTIQIGHTAEEALQILQINESI